MKKFHIFTKPLLRILMWFSCLLLFIPPVFAAIPIHGTSLKGLSATEARKKLLSAAESYLGTRYRYGGIDRGGMDCSGFIFTSFKESINYSTPRTVSGLYDWAEKISSEELQPGDLVFFVTVGSRVSHVGIYLGGGKFIHSASEGPNTGVIYSDFNESYWYHTYLGAGRALPWDTGADIGSSKEGIHEGIYAGAYAKNSETSTNGGSGQIPYWADNGFFAGFGAAWTWGGFFEGAPSLFRGVSMFASAGYKWSIFRAGLELRSEWDRALGVFRLPLTLSFGTDTFQVFAGPAYTFGEPSLGDRDYSGGGAWLGELGFSAAFPQIKIWRGLFSFYGELAWQPYYLEDDEDFSFKPDLTANLRFSTGLRYLWKL